MLLHTTCARVWCSGCRTQIGQLSRKTRVVRIKNVLTEQEDQLEVPSEETIAEIRERYSDLNAHANSYTWKALLPAAAGAPGGGWTFSELDMNKTLAENGVVDEDGTFEEHQIPVDAFLPVLHVYWNDDLTVA